MPFARGKFKGAFLARTRREFWALRRRSQPANCRLKARKSATGRSRACAKPHRKPRASRFSLPQGDRESVFPPVRPDSAGSGGSGIERATALPARAPRPRGGRAGFGRRMSGGKITFPPPVFSARLSSALVTAFRSGAGNGHLWRVFFGRCAIIRIHAKSARFASRPPGQPRIHREQIRRISPP